MGNKLSTVPREGQGHPALFYEGVTAAQQARFTVSELYFVQALRGHPGRAFWDALLQAMKQGGGDGEQMSAPPPDAGSHGSTASDDGNAVSGLESLRDADASQAESLGSGQGPLHDSAASAVRGGPVEIELPLCGRLTDIVDVYRMTADMALTYLCLLRTTRHRERVCALAARYCLMTIQHTQALLHCLALWKEAHVRDGLGLVDYAKTRGLTLGGAGEEGCDEAGAAAAAAVAAAAATVRRGGAGSSRTASLLFTLALAEAHCRYYFLSFLLAYAMLLMEAAKTTADAKRQGRIFANVLDHLDAAYELLHRVAAEYPADYGGQLIAAHVPPSVSGPVRDPHGSAAASSCVSRQKTLSVGSDTQLQLYAAAAPWLPTHSALLPLAAVRNVRLCVPASLGGAAPARLLSPAQRMSYYYCSWRSDTAFVAVPGCSAYCLERALPGFVPGKGTLAQKTEMVVGGATASFKRRSSSSARAADAGESDVVISFDTDGLGEADGEAGKETAATAAERKALLKKCKAALKRSGRNMNTDLDLSDERTLAMLCQDEASILVMQIALLAMEVYMTAGNQEAARVHATVLEELVYGNRGPGAPELHMVAFMCRALGL